MKNLPAAMLAVLCSLIPAAAHADPELCDASSDSCRTHVLSLIAAEKVGIDVSFWFMDDARYSNALVKQWKAGVPIRVIMDPRANAAKPNNATILGQLQSAGIPMRKKSSGDIAHWKGMIFSGQRVAEFSGANYSPYEYVPQVPYVDYNDEAIYFSDEPDVVDSLMTHFDDVWTDEVGYADYANITSPPVRSYPTTPIAPEFNFPPDDSYYDRLHPLMRAEALHADGRIDVTMYRITDSREANDMIYAAGRGIRVRLYSEPNEYRNPARIDDSYNVDRMYMAGVQIRMRAHTGLNHQKTVQLYSQGITVFGTSNWSTASDDNQLEVNYFTTKTWFFDWFRDLLDRKWNNSHVLPDGTHAIESTAFKPLASDKPVYSRPVNASTGVSPTAVPLKWNAGFWARQYDIYIGISPTLHLLKGNVNLGPSRTTTELKQYTLPTLQPGTTYYWQIVSKTMANLTATGPVWTFTTAGVPPHGICTDPAAINYAAAAPCVYTAMPPSAPTTPSPATGATDVKTTPTLTWKASGATSYDVSFGTTNPPPQVSAGQTAASYTPAALEATTTYFWRIVARNAAGSATGPVWSFTTGAPPPPSTVPPPWVDADIGAVGTPGYASENSGTFTVNGAGADIWNGANAFNYVYQPLNGDGELVARVASVANVAAWTKVGVMVRSTLDAHSAFAMMLVSSAKGTTFQYRTATGASAAAVNTGASAAPYWVKITRSGSTLSGYQSPDGNAWTFVGTATIPMASTAYVGLAVSSHDSSRTAAGTFDHVAFSGGAEPPPPGSLPDPWADKDVGAVGAAGSASFSNGTFTVAGSGADVWGTVDAFHFAYKPLAGDGELVARVGSVQNTASWTKAGVMIRDTLAPDSAYAFMLVSSGKGTAFQYRTSSGAEAANIAGTAVTAPFWVKVVRAGNLFSAYQSSDGSTWQPIGTATITMASAVKIGLAVSSHVNTTTATATFDNVQ